MATITRIEPGSVAVLEWGPPDRPLRVEIRAADAPEGGAVVVSPDQHCRIRVHAVSQAGHGVVLVPTPAHPRCEPS